MLLDKYGARIVVTISSFLCASGAIIFGLTDNLHIAQIARFLIGAGSACGFIVCLKLASEWFSPSRFAFIAGLTNMLGTLGATFAGVPLAHLVNLVGWQKAMIILGYAGFIVTALCWIIVKNRPNYKPVNQSQTPTVGLRKALLVLAFDKQILLAGVIGGLMYVPITSFAELWSVPFLTKSLSINSEMASFANTMIFVGMAIGSPIIAKLAFKQKSYIKLMQKSALAGGIFFMLTAFASKFGYYPSIVILLIGGMWLGGQVLCFSVVKERVPNQISGTAMAYTNALVMLGGVIFQPLMGFILDLGWSGSVDSVGARVYSLEAYQNAIFAIPACLILSWLLLKLCRDYIPKE
jgi:MFS family permease